ncbi:class A beta-lactamase [Saccharomonospora iraqiensis]|uniref:class A beta-lactamase n=1 Tax=Saccharomonospora iraqiensis TaxID=52698 RepID=UPI0003F515F9|nr:class A beta-lactamase [Saccharomonospora iraqiensis]
MRFLTRSVPALLLVTLVGCAPQQAAHPTPGPRESPTTPVGERVDSPARPDFAELERRYSARLGVYALDTGSGTEITHRADERWAFCSTIKPFTAMAVLQRTTLDGLDEPITYSREDLISHSPVTEQHVDTGMTLRAVLEAAVRNSDNTAQNLLLDEVGGPAGLQRALRELGDTVSHADRYEPELNETAPGDIRDTSTPRALATNLRKLVLGDVLAPGKRTILREAMRNPPLTADLIQAGVPDDWQVEDKSGAGGYATRNDIAVLYPPERAPIVLVVLSDRARPDAEYDDTLLAEAARVTVAALR